MFGRKNYRDIVRRLSGSRGDDKGTGKENDKVQKKMGPDTFKVKDEVLKLSLTRCDKQGPRYQKTTSTGKWIPS